MSSKLSRSYQTAVRHGMIGQSDAMNELFNRIEMYSKAFASVVITGETGTGKELVARAIHTRSPRNPFPFVALNCTALNQDLLESELFGHERGAFTGAIRSHRGRFERADKGSLFLDEIGDMPVKTQVKLLRVIEEQRLERIGGETEIPVDVRIIAATNISLEHAVSIGQFRSDLYHRLAVLRIHVPPLRDREGDLELLVEYFLDLLNQRYKKDIVRLSPDAMRLLESYRWPGNIRELRNVLERVYVETQTRIIGRNAFREWEQERDFLAAGHWNLQYSETQRLSRMPIITPHGSSSDEQRYPESKPFMPPEYQRLPRALPPGDLSASHILDGEYTTRDGPLKKTENITRDHLQRAFEKADGNITRAAGRLGIHKSTFYRYLKKFGLSREDLGPHTGI